MSDSAGPPGDCAEGESIGALLSRVRMEQGRSQLRVAEMLCAASGVPTITRHEVSRWEREDRIPGGTWLSWLAVVLDTSLDELERAAAVTREQRGAVMTGSRQTSRTEAVFMHSPAHPGGRGEPSRARPERRQAGRARAEPYHAPDWPVVERRPERFRAVRPRSPASAAEPPGSSRARRLRLAELRRMDDLVAGPELAGLVHRELRLWLAEPACAGLADGAPAGIDDTAEPEVHRGEHRDTPHRGVRENDVRDSLGTAPPGNGPQGADGAGPPVAARGAAGRAVDAAAGTVARIGPRNASDGPAGRAHLSMVAGLAQLAGWVAADAGAPASALAAFRLGLRAAARADDRPLGGHLLGCIAQLSAEEDDARSAVRLARSALRHALPTATAGTRALLALRLSYAAGLAGERRIGEGALAAAEQSWRLRTAVLEPEWLSWLDDAHFTALQGRCTAALGRAEAARPLLLAALRAPTVRFRAAAVTAAALAGAHADAGDLDAACAAAGDALMHCVRSGSVRATRLARAVEPKLRVAAPPGAPALTGYLALVSTLRPFLPPTGRRRPAGEHTRGGVGQSPAAPPDWGMEEARTAMY